MNLLRPTLRLRLTLLFGGLLIGAGVILLLSSYYLVGQAFDNGPRFRQGVPVIVQYSDGTYDRVDARDIQVQLQHHTEQALLWRGLIALGFVGLIGMGGGYLLAGRALRPLQSITATAQRLSTETLDQRIALSGPDDELKELADTFDGMIARLQSAFDSQRRFVANASHELRTPLSVIRTEVDVSLRDPDASETDLRRMGTVIRTATERADRLVDALLQLARADAQGRQALAVREKVELPAVVEAALAAVEQETAAAHLRVDTRLEPAGVMGDPGLLDRLAGNLVENAVRHNVPGGWLGVHTDSGNGVARLFVANSGAVVDPGEAPALFEPFRRGGTARTASRGAGLGLSIVRAVVHAHGGQVHAYALQGGGLEVRVELPTG
ncbi:MAG: HAMP domain-containing sensor histidine kinase [Pseudonocardiales bacterium]